MRMPEIADDEVVVNESVALEVEGVVTGALVRQAGRPARPELRRGEVDRRRAARRQLS